MKINKLALISIITLIIILFITYNTYLKNSSNESIQIAVVGPMSGNNAGTWKLTIQAIQLYLDNANKKRQKGKKIVLQIFYFPCQ